MSQQKKREVVATGRVTKKNASKTPSDLLRALSRSMYYLYFLYSIIQHVDCLVNTLY